MKTCRTLLVLTSLLLWLVPAVRAQQLWTAARPDGHAPIGVMADHTHSRGEVMLSYRFVTMHLEGNLTGTDKASNADIYQHYMVAPQTMDLQTHLVGAMFAPSNRLTLMAMLPVTRVEMDQQTQVGTAFTTDGSGLGDVRLGGMYVVYNRNRQKAHLNLAVSLPTGSIDIRDVTPMSASQEVRLPYPMQMGSGTVDFFPGMTYLGQSSRFSWGAQVLGTVRVGKNGNDYRLGDAAMGTAWLAGRWNQWVSTSVRLEGREWGDVRGADPSLSIMVTPAADPALRNGTRVDALVGLNFEVAHGSLRGQRLAVEFGEPVYQDLGGPQLEAKWRLVAGWQYAF